MKPFGIHTGSGEENWIGRFKQFLTNTAYSPTLQQRAKFFQQMMNDLNEHVQAVNNTLESALEDAGVPAETTQEIVQDAELIE